MSFGPDGLNIGCDGLYQGASFGCDDSESFSLPDVETLRNVCGESRLWGGMHFTASVSASYELCGGLGDLAWADLLEVRNGSNFTSSYIKGDPLPSRNAPGATCGIPPEASPTAEPPFTPTTEPLTGVASVVDTPTQTPTSEDPLLANAPTSVENLPTANADGMDDQTSSGSICLVLSTAGMITSGLVFGVGGWLLLGV